MGNNFLRNLKEELANRAQLSLTGNAIIGIIGGTLIMLITWFKTCQKNEDVPLETSNVQWFKQKILYLAITLDSNKRLNYFSKLGISPQTVDSVVDLMAFRSQEGAFVYEIYKHQIDSLNNIFELSIPIENLNNQLFFYVESLKQADYIVVIKDSLIQKIIHIPEK